VRKAAARQATAPLPAPSGRSWLPAALAIGLVALAALPNALPPRPPRAGADGWEAFDWRTVATLPVLHEGRIKPFDTVARNTLQLLGNRTDVRMPAEPAANAPRETPTGTVPASRWLLGLMAGSEWVDHAPIFRIDAFEVLDLFDLTRRQGHRYSAAELASGRAALRTQIEKARAVPAEERSFVQKKYGEINQKLMAYDLMRFAYETPTLPQVTGTDPAARQQAVAEMRRLMQGARMLDDNHPPALIPPLESAVRPAADTPADTAAARQDDWQALYPAVVSAMVARMLDGREGQPPYRLNPAILPLTSVLAAADGPPAELARAVADYRAAIAPLPAVQAAASQTAFEAWLNRFNPTDLAKWLYVFATVVCFASFLVWHRSLNQFVSWLLVATVVLHTFALVARIYLTGRPPVVNLYSSAVFIGWACVLAGLGLEALHRMGIGNLVAALAGGLTLMVAYGLDSGDTMHVLQAVLDTQFWLSTHVVTVTLGYGATFLAGLLGTCAIVHGIWTRHLRRHADAEGAKAVQDRLYRMTYGVVCFALFFSFIGTVLGGLWADDSWGRFWGWDPKENGALMIVLWNAAVLHARWDRWIGPRGFALFAIAGNIITAWSWFGTNQLGIGLHSYGFTSGVLMLLAGYVVSQLVLIAAGFLLTRPPAPAAV
jgi:ABC-type transport system involved in cytochrome c biogenesis permease subunit